MIVKLNHYDLDFWSCLFVGLVSLQMAMYIQSLQVVSCELFL
jgi:hypothetical protein